MPALALVSIHKIIRKHTAGDLSGRYGNQDEGALAPIIEGSIHSIF